MIRKLHSPVTKLGLIIWLLAALFFLYEFFLRTFIGSIAHQLIPDLHLSAEQFAILGSSYAVTYGIMQIPVGILIDKFGVRFNLAFAALICGLATILFTQIDSFHGALASRVLVGLHHPLHLLAY